MWIINRNATPVNCCVQYVTHSSGHTFHTFLYMQGFISKFVAPSPASQAAHWKVPKIPPSCPLFSCIFYHSLSPLATFTELKITNGKNKRIVNSAVMCRHAWGCWQKPDWEWANGRNWTELRQDTPNLLNLLSSLQFVGWVLKNPAQNCLFIIFNNSESRKINCQAFLSLWSEAIQ